MSRKIILLLLSIIVCINLVVAFNFQTLDLNDLKQTANANAHKLPGFVRGAFGNAKINLYINNQYIYHADISHGLIQELAPGAIEDPTIIAHMSEQTLDKIINKEITFGDALDSGAIDYEAIGFATSMKCKAVIALLKIRGYLT